MLSAMGTKNHFGIFVSVSRQFSSQDVKRLRKML
jgi:hypothetical protein